MTNITTGNYLEVTKDIDFSVLPEALQKGHDMALKLENENWHYYNINENIKRVCNAYFEKLREWIERQPKSKLPDNVHIVTVPKSETKKAKQQTKVKQAKPKSEKAKSRLIEKLPIEVAFIKRYTLMDGKVKTQAQILTFIHSLQKAITEKLIGKSSAYAEEIEQIQDQLINLYEEMDTSVLIEIDTNNLTHYKGIVNSYEPMQSVALLKRYIALNGKKDIKDKALRLIKQIDKAIEKQEITESDKYWKPLNDARKTLNLYIDEKNEALKINQAELSGLHGLDGGLGFVVPLITGVAANVIAGQINKVIDKEKGTVIGSVELAGMEFETLPLDGDFKALIGIPSRNFSAMVYGKPGSGKTTWCIQFAKYLAQRHNLKVLFATIEEGINHTAAEKLNRLRAVHLNLSIADHMPDDLSGYDAVFIDSINSFRYSTNDLRTLRKQYPNMIFVYIFQSTKDGKFKGSQEYEHDVDTVIRAENGTISTIGCKNRFGVGNTLKIW